MASETDFTGPASQQMADLSAVGKPELKRKATSVSNGLSLITKLITNRYT